MEPSKRLSEMTDAEVFAEANKDRAKNLGKYGMTMAMEEEQRRLSRARGYDKYGCPGDGIWDE